MSSNFKLIAEKYDPIQVGSIDRQDKEPHDNAIVRAINREYNPNFRLPGNARKTLFVGRLHPKVTTQELEQIFKKYGDIKLCRVIHDIVTGFSKQYGFVEFVHGSDAERAYSKAHEKIVRGAEIIVDWEFGRTMPGWKPRSLGGGFGGRKESGQLRFGCRDRPWRRPLGIGHHGEFNETHRDDSRSRHRRKEQ